MKKQSFLLSVLFTVMLALSACSPIQYRVVERTEYVHVGVGQTLTEHIVPDIMPRQNYVQVEVDYKGEKDPVKQQLMRTEKRLSMANDYIDYLIGVSIQLNQRLDSIHDYDVKNSVMVDDQNKKEQKRVNDIINGKVKELTQ